MDDAADGSSGMNLWDIYDDYIEGRREIAEINASMSGVLYGRGYEKQGM